MSGWFELRENNKDEEIQGELHMEISKTVCDEKIFLKVKVIEARSASNEMYSIYLTT